MTLVEFLRAGDSFRICAEGHRWPSFEMFDAFVQCGCDDAGGEVLEWLPFRVEPAEYAAARIEVDPDGVVDSLGVRDGDWAAWFQAAVGMLRLD